LNTKISQLINLFVALALTLGVYISVSALPVNTYYMSETGNDANGCSMVAPCKTINKVMSLAQAGDTINILAGTYNQHFVISKSNITVYGAGAIIDGTNTGEDICVVINGNNVVLDGLTVKNCYTHGISVYGSGDTVQNSLVTNTSLENSPASTSNNWGSAFKSDRGATNVKFLNNIAKENFGEGFGITMTNGAVLSGNISMDNYSVDIYPDESSNVLIDGNFAVCSGNPTFNRNNNRPTGIAFGEEQYSGWSTPPRNIVVSHNVISGCGTGIIFWGSAVPGGGLDTVIIQNNTVYSGVKPALSLAYSSTNKNVLVSNNIFYSSPSPWVENITGLTLRDNFWISSIPGGNARGTNDKAGYPLFIVPPIWDEVDTFKQATGSPACGYGRWDCVISVQTSQTPTSTLLPTLVYPTNTETPTSTQIPSTVTNTPSFVTETATFSPVPPSPTASILPTTISETSTISSISVSPTATIAITESILSATITSSPISQTSTLLTPTLTNTLTPIPSTTTDPIISTQISGTPTAVSKPSVQQGDRSIFDDKDSHFVFSLGWRDVFKRQAIMGSYKLTTANGSWVTFDFTGQSFSVVYTGGPAFKKMNVYIDGVFAGIINEKADVSTYQKRWTYQGQLNPGSHKLKLVFVTNSASNTFSSVDAVIVR
jgi:hypothetical protein